MRITSVTNSKVKQIVALRNRKDRDYDQLTIVEGEKEIELALNGEFKFKDVFTNVTLSSKITDRLDVDVTEVSDDVFAKISYGKKTQGVLAVVCQKQHALDQLKLKTNALVIVVEQVEKPGNLGAILRTADAAGCDAVIVCDGKTDLYNPNVIRASLGAVFTMKIGCASLEQVLEFLNNEHFQILTASPDAKCEYTQCDFKKSTAVVFGSEHEGLTNFWKTNSIQQITIPMFGSVDSLNVSASTAIVLYEAIRQRRK